MNVATLDDRPLPRSHARHLAGVVAPPSLALAATTLLACAVPEDGEAVGLAAALESSFPNVVALCSGCDSFGGSTQMDYSNWDPDVAPVIEWIVGQTGLHCSTYEGHHPTKARAADWWPRTRQEGTDFANWLRENTTGGAAPMGIWYMMWQAHIGYEDRVDDVADRGSCTQNHCDHIHLAFLDDVTVDFRPGDVTPWGTTPPTPDAAPPRPDAAPPAPDAAPPPSPDAAPEVAADAAPPEIDPPGQFVGGCGCAAAPRRGAGPLSPALLLGLAAMATARASARRASRRSRA